MSIRKFDLPGSNNILDKHVWGALSRKLRSPCVSTVPRMTFKKKQYVIGKGEKDFMRVKEERRDYSRRYKKRINWQGWTRRNQWRKEFAEEGNWLLAGKDTCLDYVLLSGPVVLDRVIFSNVFGNGIFFVEVNIAIIIMYNNENGIKHLQINRMLFAAFIF